MLTNNEDETKLVGQITVSDIQEQPDGSLKVIFDYDENFKKEYKRLFGLKKFSKKHFQKTLDKAIQNMASEVETEAGLLKLREDIIKLNGE